MLGFWSGFPVLAGAIEGVETEWIINKMDYCHKEAPV